LITAVTLGELSFSPHATDDPIKRAGRVAVLQHVEATFDPLPYDQGAARLYGQICAAVRAAGREACRRASDLMIAATADSNQLPLYTANPDDFKGTEGFVEMVGHPSPAKRSLSGAGDGSRYLVGSGDLARRAAQVGPGESLCGVVAVTSAVSPTLGSVAWI
jgi:predicted nucleic acid-binding protein